MSVELCRYLIRMNGAPFFEITLPSYMNPVQAAREVLLHGVPDVPGVSVNWHPAAQS
jgi:hypothetical protein